jgi:3-hydroxyacyl-[acyl-carrier-protein] dehydratase
MRFLQLDAVTNLIPGGQITATRTLRAEEDYLRDHFPLFPVMPGVLMLEGLYQAACLLIRATDNFDSSLLVMKEVRNAKFADFVEPGDTLDIEAEIVKNESNRVTIKASGSKAGNTAVSARIIVERLKLGAQRPDLVPLDRYLAKNPRELLETLMTRGRKTAEAAHENS